MKLTDLINYQSFLYNKSIVFGFYNQVVLLVYEVFASFYAHCFSIYKHTVLSEFTLREHPTA